MPNPVEELDQFLTDNGLTRIEFHGTDYAWGFRENEPIIALITGQDGGIAFQSAISLYWASADYISKPWCLLLDVAEIAPHQRAMLDNLASQYNIKLLTKNELIETASMQLSNLLSILDVYVPEDKSVTALGEAIRNWRTEKTAHEYSYDIAIETGNLDVYKENDELTPSRKTIPLTTQSDNIRIEGILPRLISVEDGLFFDTEHRNLPMVFKLRISPESTLVTRFEADKSNIIEATAFWGLHHAFASSKRLAFIEPNTGDILFNCGRGLNERGDS